jgi:hypothetical protein
VLERSSQITAQQKSQPEVVVVQKTVRGNTASNMRPYVCIDGVRYTNKLLASMAAVNGRNISLRIDAGDMRTLYGNLDSGEDIGVLVPIGSGRTIAARGPFQRRSIRCVANEH